MIKVVRQLSLPPPETDATFLCGKFKRQRESLGSARCEGFRGPLGVAVSALRSLQSESVESAKLQEQFAVWW